MISDQEVNEISKILDSGVKVTGWCCVCGMPITDGLWTLILKVKTDDTYKKGFRIDNLKRHTGCLKD